MKTKSVLQNLSEADQAMVLDLCRHHTYEQAVEILAEPRPIGLGLKTSVSALCRFYTLYHPALYALQVDRQTADILAQQNYATFLPATLTLIQQRIFASLLAGASLDQTLPALRFMLRLRATLQLSPARNESAEKEEHAPPPAAPPNPPQASQTPSPEAALLSELAEMSDTDFTLAMETILNSTKAPRNSTFSTKSHLKSNPPASHPAGLTP